jgi:hypothetical protein
MKASKLQLISLAGLLALTLPLSAQGYGGGNPGGGRGGLRTTLVALTADETQWLTFMREEERLARDLYTLPGSSGTWPFFPHREQRGSPLTTMGKLLTGLRGGGSVERPARGHLCLPQLISSTRSRPRREPPRRMLEVGLPSKPRHPDLRRC